MMLQARSQPQQTKYAIRRLHLLAAAALLLLTYSLSRMLRTSSVPTTGTNPISSQVLRAPMSNADSFSTMPKSKGKIFLRDLYVAGYEKAHPELCPDFGVNLKLLVLVHSAPSHLPARTAIRLTWGGYLVRRNVSLAFVLGKPPDALRSIIEFEDMTYGDMVIGHSVDSYSNLTLKTLSMLEWVGLYCQRTPTLMKTDDDLFVNAPRLLQIVTSKFKASRTIWGRVLHQVRARRMRRNKYYMPRMQYPGAVYPDFVGGAAYLMSADCVGDLVEAAPVEPYVRLEDVFFTGLLAASLNITRKQAFEYRFKKTPLHRCALRTRLVQHMVSYRQQFALWNKLIEGQRMC